MAFYNTFNKFQFLKLLRYLFGLIPNNIRKHLNLYEFREIYHFLSKIFKPDSHPINIFSLLLKKYSIFYTEFLNLVIINYYQPLLLLANIKKQTSKYLNYFLLKKNEFSSKIFCKYNFRFLETYFRNFILFIRKLMFQPNFNFGSSIFNMNKIEAVFFSSFTNNNCLSSYFSENLIKKFTQAVSWKNFCLENELKAFFPCFIQKIFSLEEFIMCFGISSLKIRVIKFSNLFPFFIYRILKKIKIENKKVFTSQKFLTKLKNWFGEKNLSVSIQEMYKCMVFSYNFGNKNINYSPIFKGNILIIELFHTHLLSFFDLERCEVKLSSVTLLRIFIIHSQSLKYVNKYNLFIFKILNLIYILKIRILDGLFNVEKKFEKIYAKDNNSYTILKEVVLVSNKISVFKNKNGHIIFLKLVGFIKKLIRNLYNKSDISKKYNNLYLLKNKKVSIVNRRKNFLKKSNNWQNIFENRMSCFSYLAMDFNTPISIRNLYELNDYNFRRTGF